MKDDVRRVKLLREDAEVDGFGDSGIVRLKTKLRFGPAGGQPRPGWKIFHLRIGGGGFLKPFRYLGNVGRQFSGRLASLADGFKSGRTKQLFPNLSEQSSVSINIRMAEFPIDCPDDSRRVL